MSDFVFYYKKSISLEEMETTSRLCSTHLSNRIVIPVVVVVVEEERRENMQGKIFRVARIRSMTWRSSDSRSFHEITERMIA